MCIYDRPHADLKVRVHELCFVDFPVVPSLKGFCSGSPRSATANVAGRPRGQECYTDSTGCDRMFRVRGLHVGTVT